MKQYLVGTKIRKALLSSSFLKRKVCRLPTGENLSSQTGPVLPWRAEVPHSLNFICAFLKVGLISGTVFVILGLTVLAVGFLVPPKIEAFGEANFVVVDTHAVQFNGALDMCKLAGAVLFCIGGTSMAGCLLMSVFAKSYSKEEKFLQLRFKERIADIKAHTQPITRAPGPGETTIPVTLSRVHHVQPLAAP